MDVSSSTPINTQRLVLRWFTDGDVDDLYSYQGLESVARYLYRPAHTLDRSKEVIRDRVHATRWQEDADKLAFAICRPQREGLIGEVTLTLTSAHSRQAEIGWVLHPDHEGHGYATEAAKAAAELAFDVLDVHRLYARLDAENTGSTRICERLGMRKEAHLIDNELDQGRWGSEYIYAAFQHDLIR